MPLVASCASSGGGASGLRTEPLSAAVAEPCPHPTEFLGAADWEILAGRIGDALIVCGAEKDIAVEAYEGLRAAVNGG